MISFSRVGVSGALLSSSIARVFHKIVIRVLSDNIVKQVGTLSESGDIGIVIATLPADPFCPSAVDIRVDSGFATWTHRIRHP
jgi:hypothetical protein